MHKDKVHVVKRADTGLLAGLYGFDETKPEHIIESIELEPYIHIFHMQSGTWMQRYV